MRLIDADELINKVLTEWGTDPQYVADTTIDGIKALADSLILERLHKMQTIDPVRHGHWILVNHWCDTNRVCSVCGKSDLFAITYNIEEKENRHDYCPYCGARMDGDGE